MNSKYEPLYRDLLNDMARCRQLELPDAEIAEHCYRVALNYWRRLKEYFGQRMMYVDEEEMDFFKAIKPQFTAHIEYNLLLNQALLFIPADKEAAIRYWKEEEGRYQRFQKRNADFIQYYDSGCREKDADYFLLRNYRADMKPQERIYEDEDCRSFHDHIVRGLLANRMYHEYVEDKLKQLSNDTVDSRSSE